MTEGLLEVMHALLVRLGGVEERVRVFVSHRRADEAVAVKIAQRLREHDNVSAWVDALDETLGKGGCDITRYVMRRLAECTHLVAVVSRETRASWWVPFEIGVASSSFCPLATYAVDETVLPEFLESWPYLKTMEDIDQYAELALNLPQTLIMEQRGAASTAERAEYAASFHRKLKKALGQP